MSPRDRGGLLPASRARAHRRKPRERARPLPCRRPDQQRHHRLDPRPTQSRHPEHHLAAPLVADQAPATPREAPHLPRTTISGGLRGSWLVLPWDRCCRGSVGWRRARRSFARRSTRTDRASQNELQPRRVDPVQAPGADRGRLDQFGTPWPWTPLRILWCSDTAGREKDTCPGQPRRRTPPGTIRPEAIRHRSPMSDGSTRRSDLLARST